MRAPENGVGILARLRPDAPDADALAALAALRLPVRDLRRPD